MTRKSFQNGSYVDGFDVAASNIRNLNQKLIAIGEDAAEELADLLEENTIAHVPRTASLLAATIGSYKPEEIEDDYWEGKLIATADAVMERYEEWAITNGLSSGPGIEMGALKLVKRHRANEWSATVGTFNPYAHLVNDGASIMINPFGNPRVEVMAHFAAAHFLEKGRFDTEMQAQHLIQRVINKHKWHRMGR